MSLYPVPFRITSVLLESVGHVDVVTSQYLYGNVTRFETCLFWSNDGESSEVDITYNRDVALKNHFRWTQPEKIAKEIYKVRSRKNELL